MRDDIEQIVVGYRDLTQSLGKEMERVSAFFAVTFHIDAAIGAVDTNPYRNRAQI